MNNEKDLLSLKDAKAFFKKEGYDIEELNQYTDLEIRVLATDQKARKNEKK